MDVVILVNLPVQKKKGLSNTEHHLLATPLYLKFRINTIYTHLSREEPLECKLNWYSKFYNCFNLLVGSKILETFSEFNWLVIKHVVPKQLIVPIKMTSYNTNDPQ